MSDARFYHISPAGELLVLPSLADALMQGKSGGCVWLDYCQPTPVELSGLIEPFDLHPLTIEDCTDENQVPKIDDFPHNAFLLLNAFSYYNGDLSIEEVDLILGANFLITISRPGADGVHPLRDIEGIVRRDMENARQGPAFLLHVILDHVVDQKFTAIEKLEEELDGTEENILSDAANFNPAAIIGLRRDLLAIRKSLFHEREILVKICRKDCPFIPESAIFFYRDIYDHLAKFFELTESYRDIVASLMEMYLSTLNNQMTRAANETNTTVRRLTFITTIFMPLTLLAGIGGMSEWSMMTGPENWRIAYPVFILAMIVIAVINYYFLKRLDRRDHPSN